jgi:hypothetical protein
MDIGTERETIIVEPLEDPFAPQQPVETPAPEQPVKVPA